MAANPLVCSWGPCAEVMTNDKDPPKGQALPEVEGKGANPKCCYLRSVDSLEIEITLWTGTFSARRRDHTHFSTGVDKESYIIVGIVYVKETT